MRRTQQSFAGGEISPEMQGRIEAPDYQSGLEVMQNFLALPQGPAQMRPGFRFVRLTKKNGEFGGATVEGYSKARLVPFKFSESDSLVMEWGVQRIEAGTITAVDLANERITDSTKSWTTTSGGLGGQLDRAIVHIPELDGQRQKNSGRYTIQTTPTTTGMEVFVNATSQDLSDVTAGMAYYVYRGYVRIHVNGATLLWGTPRNVSAIDFTTDVISFDGEHGFAADDEVRFIETKRLDASSTLPSPLTQTTVYYVRVVDARRIELAATPGGAKIALTENGSVDGTEVFRIWLDADVPQTYRTGQVEATPGAIDTGADTITFSAAHDFVDGQRVRFGTTGTPPTSSPAFSTSTDYYVIVVSPTVIQIEETVGGGAIDLLTPGSAGTITAHALYDNGTLVFQDAPSGGFFYANGDVGKNLPPNTWRQWHRMGDAGEFEFDHAIDENALFEFTYAQSNDVISIAHNRADTRSIKRFGALDWRNDPIVFESAIGTPTVAPSVTVDRGQFINVTDISNSSGSVVDVTTANHHLLQPGDIVSTDHSVPPATAIKNEYWVIKSDGLGSVTCRLATPDGKEDPGLITGSTSARLYYVPGLGIPASSGVADHDNTQTYVYTAVDELNVETEASPETAVTNNLAVSGSYNEVTITAVDGAARYNIYKKESGLFGYVGQVEEDGSSLYDFLDRNIAPDLGRSLPIQEGDPGAVSAIGYFDQRRLFGGTLPLPLTVWMSRVGTESDLSYSVPIKPDDRIKFVIAARSRAKVRHFASLDQLVILTDEVEFRVTPVNDDAITPESVSVRPQSYIGSSPATPVIVNNLVVFAANRGGHMRELGYQREALGYVTGDLSLRAAHLFDTFEIKDMAFQKSPYPMVWAVSTSGKLLCMTYVPEERLRSWHQHTTAAGSFESTAAIAEGDEDTVYAVTQRTAGGESIRSVECMAPQRFGGLLPSAFFVDSGLTADLANSSTKVVRVEAAGTGYVLGAEVNLISTSHLFRTDGSDVGDLLTVSTGEVEITSVTDSMNAIGRVVQLIPAAVQNVATADWAWKRKTFSGLDHLAGETVSVLADGVPTVAVVSASGGLTLTTAATIVHVGLPIGATMRTLPMTAGVEGGGQGRTRNPSDIWIKVEDSAGGFAGGILNQLSPTGLTTNALQSRVVDVSTRGEWDEGQVYIQQSLPLPLTVVSITIDY